MLDKVGIMQKRRSKMELSEAEKGSLGDYLGEYETLIGDKRTSETLEAVVEGIIGSESLKAARIGRFSPSTGDE
jgi:hypothetical protein